MSIKTFQEVKAKLKGKAILVANRGISARRICRSIRERFEAIAIMTATDIDKTAPAAGAAQELLLLGSDPLAYLNIDTIIKLAKQREVIAIHPGWGFASEDSLFPQKCAEAGLVFIGATSEAMNLLGNKVQARNIAKKLNVPIVPGSEGAVDIITARKLIYEMGLPIMLKAEGGGGGRGIFIINNIDELEDAFFKASIMAQASFGNPRLFVEKYLNKVRHIEIQVIADQHGNAFAFDERDCTIQRNHQKLIEITPSPWSGLTPELRERLKKYAKSLVLEVGYSSLATVEFLVTADGEAYMIEVNTRLQVEHGITECRYGIDLVEEQIAIAFGAELQIKEAHNMPMHFAMQVRINCENPQMQFSPNSGLISRYISPGGPGVRLDSNLSAGYEFPPNYDSAGSLLISYSRDWEKTIAIMKRALSEYVVNGVKTTIPFYLQVLKHHSFYKGDFDTNFIANNPELMCYTDSAPEGERLAKLVMEISAKGYNPHVQLGKYRTVDTPRMPIFEPVLPQLIIKPKHISSPYPKGNCKETLEFIRDSNYIHFTDTTPRDITQSNSGNRFRLAEDALIGPYLDNVGYFSIENGGGAHFHVAMLANMTYPFKEAEQWNKFAPNTFKQILVRSTNILGYTPQPKNLMRLTCEMICEHYHVIRCFDFLNHIDNMKPLAEVILNNNKTIFEPAISLSWSKYFDVNYYMGVTEAILDMSSKVMGVSKNEISKSIILGLKDMAGVCPPRFMTELIHALRKKWPELILHYHRHYTDGLFVPTCGAAAKAGAHIIDVGLGSSVRSYGQGDVLSTAAYMEDELGLRTNLQKDVIRQANFVCKQIMPYYDRYCAPYFQGIDYDVVEHGMPGGATSSSQEGAFKQGYIRLLPYMLKYLASTRKIVHYHDVTPGSQITWNTAFLAVTGAFKRGGEQEVRYLLSIMDEITHVSISELSPIMLESRLLIYQDCNDAFRNLLLGKFGKLPLGFPEDWVYQSAFGNTWKTAIAERTDQSPLLSLPEIDLVAERKTLTATLKRDPSAEEFILYLNHPGDALKTINFKTEFGDPNNLPVHVWFEGLQTGQDLNFNDSNGKPHHLAFLTMSRPNENGISTCRYVLDSELMNCDVKIRTSRSTSHKGLTMADPKNQYHLGAPSNGDLWITYVSPGDIVKVGEELFNISIMKQEKAVLSPIDGIVKRVLKTADYKESKQMVSVSENELIVELGPIPLICNNEACSRPILFENIIFCPYCGDNLEK